jgi:hypothetical protein
LRRLASPDRKLEAVGKSGLHLIITWRRAVQSPMIASFTPP